MCSVTYKYDSFSQPPSDIEKGAISKKGDMGGTNWALKPSIREGRYNFKVDIKVVLQNSLLVKWTRDKH